MYHLQIVLVIYFFPVFLCVFFSLSFSAFWTAGMMLSRSGDMSDTFLVTSFKGKAPNISPVKHDICSRV